MFNILSHFSLFPQLTAVDDVLPLNVSIRMPLRKTRQTGPPLPKQLAMAHLAIRTPNTKTLHRAMPRV